MVFLTCFDTSITANKTKKDLVLAAIVIRSCDCAKRLKLPPMIEEPRISKATPKLAPELIPST